MSLLDWINPFSKVIDVVDKFVEDKDKAAELKHQLNMGAQQVYLTELNTKTVPWVDALHKMSRNIGSWLGYGLAFYMVHQGYDPMAAMAACAPGGIYNWQKGKGK